MATTSCLAPGEMSAVSPDGFAVHPSGTGRRVVTDDVTLPAVRRLLVPCPGRPDELRHVFGDTEVRFTARGDANRVQVSIRRL